MRQNSQNNRLHRPNTSSLPTGLSNNTKLQRLTQASSNFTTSIHQKLTSSFSKTTNNFTSEKQTKLFPQQLPTQPKSLIQQQQSLNSQGSTVQQEFQKQSLMKKQAIYLYIRKYLNSQSQNINIPQMKVRNRYTMYNAPKGLKTERRSFVQSGELLPKVGRQSTNRRSQNSTVQKSPSNVELDLLRPSDGRGSGGHFPVTSRHQSISSRTRTNQMLRRDDKIQNLHRNGHHQGQVSFSQKDKKSPQSQSKKSTIKQASFMMTEKLVTLQQGVEGSLSLQQGVEGSLQQGVDGNVLESLDKETEYQNKGTLINQLQKSGSYGFEEMRVRMKEEIKEEILQQLRNKQQDYQKTLQDRAGQEKKQVNAKQQISKAQTQIVVLSSIVGEQQSAQQLSIALNELCDRQNQLNSFINKIQEQNYNNNYKQIMELREIIDNEQEFLVSRQEKKNVDQRNEILVKIERREFSDKNVGCNIGGGQDRQDIGGGQQNRNNDKNNKDRQALLIIAEAQDLKQRLLLIEKEKQSIILMTEQKLQQLRKQQQHQMRLIQQQSLAQAQRQLQAKQQLQLQNNRLKQQHQKQLQLLQKQQQKTQQQHFEQLNKLQQQNIQEQQQKIKLEKQLHHQKNKYQTVSLQHLINSLNKVDSKVRLIDNQLMINQEKNQNITQKKEEISQTKLNSQKKKTANLSHNLKEIKQTLTINAHKYKQLKNNYSTLKSININQSQAHSQQLKSLNNQINQLKKQIQKNQHQYQSVLKEKESGLNEKQKKLDSSNLSLKQKVGQMGNVKREIVNVRKELQQFGLKHQQIVNSNKRQLEGIPKAQKIPPQRILNKSGGIIRTQNHTRNHQGSTLFPIKETLQKQSVLFQQVKRKQKNPHFLKQEGMSSQVKILRGGERKRRESHQYQRYNKLLTECRFTQVEGDVDNCIKNEQEDVRNVNIVFRNEQQDQEGQEYDGEGGSRASDEEIYFRQNDVQKYSNDESTNFIHHEVSFNRSLSEGSFSDFGQIYMNSVSNKILRNQQPQDFAQSSSDIPLPSKFTNFGYRN